MSKFKLPSLLSFERKLEPSDALMYAGNWQDIPTFSEEKQKQERDNKWINIEITPRYNRSTQSAYKIEDNNKVSPNLASSGDDDAVLPPDKNTLKVSFTLKVIGGVGTPFACNDLNFARQIQDYVNQFKNNTVSGSGLKELAYRYAYNIANGRFLWRNRISADDIIIHVYNNEEKQPLTFKAYDYSLKNFELNSSDKSLEKLTNFFYDGLNNENKFIFLKVDAYIKLGEGQHVFPSQKMNKDEIGKKLFQLRSCAAIHNVKIGNAIRTIDNWYGDKILFRTGRKTTDIVELKKEERIPIAIEPYGSVTQRGCAYRPNEKNLYTLILNWINDKKIDEDEKIFVVANFIRGGVFSGESETKKGEQ